ncbi:hypothetical protein V7068_08220 [Bacillus sp. JJ634]
MEILHPGHEGQNPEIQQENVLHPGHEGQNSANPARKCPSSE